MRYMWLMAFAVLPLVGLAYVSWRIWHLLPLGTIWRWGAVAAGILLLITMFLNFGGVIERMPIPLARVSYNVGYSYIFVLLYIVMIFIILDIAKVAHLLPRQALSSNVYTTVGVIIFILGIFIYGNLHYRHKVRQILPLRTEKQTGAKPIRIVMMSDLHIGYHNRRAELARWIDLINAENPDLVLIGGDIIDMSMRPIMDESMAEEFHRINAPVYACLGNHEYYGGVQLALKFYADAGITLLRDGVAEIGSSLAIIGRDDLSGGQRADLDDLVSRIDTCRFTILLDHEPYGLNEAEQAGIDFQFSGHTHHGQVFPFNLMTNIMYECAFGKYRRGHTQYYISSGIGIWGCKFRIGTRSEYIVATLTFPE